MGWVQIVLMLLKLFPAANAIMDKVEEHRKRERELEARKRRDDKNARVDSVTDRLRDQLGR